MPAVGLDISDRSVHFAELLRGKDGLRLGRYGVREVPEGVIKSGEIKNESALIDVLLRLRKEENLSWVHVSLPEQSSYLVQMHLPQVKKQEIRDTIELQLEEHIPLASGNTEFDYVLSRCGNKENRGRYVGVAAMPERVIKQYVRLLNAAELMPASFELEAHAIARSVIERNDCGTYMIVEIGASRTSIEIVSEKIVRFTATINIGGTLLTRAVAKMFHLSPRNAQERKEKKGLMRNEEKQDIPSALVPVISTLRDEIEQYFEYWSTHHDKRGSSGSTENRKKIERVLFAGGEANVPGLVEYLSKGLKVPVELANPWTNITSFSSYIPEIPHNISLSYATALGLALRSFN